MKRFRIKLEYDGTKFVGWQRQINGLGVQQVVEEALGKLCNQSVFVQCAGRTDSGVHAFGQIAHFDLEKNWDSTRLRDGINYYLKNSEVVILEATETDKTFNARFDAIQRMYLYRIINRRPPVALDKGKVWWVPVQLNSKIMDDAAKVLIGNHDFSTFRGSECQAKSPIKTLDELNVNRIGNEIKIFATAKSFLYHQVRNIVGALKLVGEGKWTVEDLKTALLARDRACGGPMAPAEGLYFLDAIYSTKK